MEQEVGKLGATPMAVAKPVAAHVTVVAQPKAAKTERECVSRASFSQLEAF